MRAADRSLMRRFPVLAAALLPLLAVAPAASSSTLGASVARRGVLERSVARELNRVRVSHGLRPLRFGDGLRLAAEQHSRSMLELGYFEHESPDGTTFDARIRRYYPDRGW